MPAANASAHPPRPGSLRAWSVAVRPWSFPVAVCPVAVGATLAWQQTGHVDGTTAALILIAAVLMQAATNLQNDVGFTRRRAGQTGGHTGPPRATAEGWLGLRQVQWAVAGVSLLGALVGSVLVARCGWPVLVIGSASLAAALAYMGGPRPIAYTALGELTVFLFFGVLAVAGTEWALVGSVDLTGALASLCLGALAAAVLAVNNHRDREHDARAGRRTLVVALGEAASRRMFSLLMAMPFLLLMPMGALARAPALLLPALLAPVAWRLARDFRHADGGPAFNALLARAFRLELGWSALMCIALLATGPATR